MTDLLPDGSCLCRSRGSGVFKDSHEQLCHQNPGLGFEAYLAEQADGIFRRHLKLPPGQITTTAVKKAPRWRKLENPVKSFLGNSLHLLSEALLQLLFLGGGPLHAKPAPVPVTKPDVC